MVFLLSFLASVSFGAANGQNWTDRNEYDLVLTIRSESVPQNRLELLDIWKTKYPKTDLREARLELYLTTYAALGDRAHIFDTSKELLSLEPSSKVGLYWSAVVLPDLDSPPAEALAIGEKSAQTLLAGLDTYFTPGLKPASLSDAEWQKQRSHVEVLAHRTLGWAHWQESQFAEAEKEFTTCLQKAPQDHELSAWLGIVMALQDGKQVPALWHLARGSKAEAGSSLPEEERRQVNAMFERTYSSYHGTMDGADELRASASTSTFPPPEFSIEPATVVAARKAEAELQLTNPELASWLMIRRELDSTNGETYFTTTLQPQPLPRLKGTVVRKGTNRNPHELALSMNGSGTADVILKLNANQNKYFAAGTKLVFRGRAQSFSKNPFELVVSADAVALDAVVKSAVP
jgi:hypothetical protein